MSRLMSGVDLIISSPSLAIAESDGVGSPAESHHRLCAGFCLAVPFKSSQSPCPLQFFLLDRCPVVLLRRVGAEGWQDEQQAGQQAHESTHGTTPSVNTARSPGGRATSRACR